MGRCQGGERRRHCRHRAEHVPCMAGQEDDLGLLREEERGKCETGAPRWGWQAGEEKPTAQPS